MTYGTSYIGSKSSASYVFMKKNGNRMKEGTTDHNTS